MKTWLHILIAVAMSLCLASKAQAQEEFFLPEKSPEKVVQVNPVQQFYEGGKLTVVVGTTRNFGWRIGDVIPVTVVMSAEDGVRINIDTLLRRVIAHEGSDFKLVGSPRLVETRQGNRNILVIELNLRSWVIEPALSLELDFMYAVASLPGSKTPDWRAAKTPELIITRSMTASELSAELDLGNMKAKTSPEPLLARPLLFAGWSLVCLVPVSLLVGFLYRRLSRKPLTPAQLARYKISRILRRARKTGLNQDRIRDLAAVLREYLQVETASADELNAHLQEFFKQDENKELLVSWATTALKTCDLVLFSKAELADSDKIELIKQIQAVVPAL